MCDGDRKQFVKLSVLTLNLISVTTGVQGESQIEPLLFILFMDAIPDILSSSNSSLIRNTLIL